MQTFVVEARRHEDGPWARVTTVQEDLVDDVARIIADGPTPGDWRLRPEDPDVNHPRPVQAPAVMPRPSRWERIRWWFMLRTSKQARR